ncbi:MAG: hypothetical protein P4L36_03365 [Holophaga sp.]|nr:hypothetical protein [Holophaga sp.]
MMRIVPLLPSSGPPDPWRSFPAVELAWTGTLHPGWLQPGPQVHALHLPWQPWGPDLGETALAALRPRLGADFLVLRAGLPDSRAEHSASMAVLEGLLEVAQGEGQKLVLRPLPGAAPGLVRQLREARGEAVGFCWDAGAGGDLASFEDRLFCAVGEPGDDFQPIQALGYRWNLAIPAGDPDTLRQAQAEIERDFPPVLFPQPNPRDPLERP